MIATAVGDGGRMVTLVIDVTFAADGFFGDFPVMCTWIDEGRRRTCGEIYEDEIDWTDPRAEPSRRCDLGARLAPTMTSFAVPWEGRTYRFYVIT